MKTKLNIKVNRVFNEFGSYLLRRKLQGDNTLTEKIFYQFIGQNYKNFDKNLRQLSTKENKPYLTLIYENLSGEQRKIYGPLFKPTEEQRIKLNNSLENKVLHSKEIQDYRRELQPYLNKEQNKRFVEKLAKLLYNRLDDDSKKRTNPQTLKIQILNLGFIRLTRASRHEAIDVLVKYAPLFKNEEDVLYHLAERYAEEELIGTPIKYTQKRIRELKKEIKELNKK